MSSTQAFSPELHFQVFKAVSFQILFFQFATLYSIRRRCKRLREVLLQSSDTHWLVTATGDCSRLFGPSEVEEHYVG